jgi:hypothetical protein
MEYRLDQGEAAIQDCMPPSKRLSQAFTHPWLPAN